MFFAAKVALVLRQRLFAWHMQATSGAAHHRQTSNCRIGGAWGQLPFLQKAPDKIDGQREQHEEQYSTHQPLFSTTTSTK